jgi:hypothetical protein
LAHADLEDAPLLYKTLLGFTLAVVVSLTPAPGNLGTSTAEAKGPGGARAYWGGARGHYHHYRPYGHYGPYGYYGYYGYYGLGGAYESYVPYPTPVVVEGYSVGGYYPGWGYRYGHGYGYGYRHGYGYRGHRR